MKKTKKALASLAIAGMALTMIPFNAFANGTVPTRLAGTTAEQTAAAIADQTGYTGTAILASSASYGMVDALTAGPLAASLKAPILLTGAGNSLDAATKAELTKLAVKTVYVTSGTAVIKQGVLDELKGMDIEVIALGGFDRAETSVNIAKKMTGVTKVAVANSIPDALSIASVASATNQPILLTDKEVLPATVADYLASAGVTASDVIGGTGVISDAVVAGLPGATRHAGMTAYDTNNQVIQDFAATLQFDNVYVANGETGIDALAGAPLAAQSKSAIVLTDGKTVPAAAAFTFSKSSASTVVTALGGEAVVPESVRVGVATGNVTSVPGELAIVSVIAMDDTNRFLKIEFNKAVSGLEAANISIVNSKTGDVYGVKTVSLSSNGLTAQLELFAGDDGDTILSTATAYTVTVNVNGTIMKTSFVRPAHLDEDDDARVTNVDSGDRQITVSYTGGTVTLDVPTASDLNFQKALGQVIRVWFDGEDQLIKYEYNTQTIVYDAIVFDRKDRVKTMDEEVKYDLATNCVVIANDGAGNELSASTPSEIEAIFFTGAPKSYDYSKLILNDDGDVERIYAYNATGAPILVEEVDGTYIQGYGSDELDLKDYRIVNGLGNQITIADIKADSIVFFNAEAYGGDGIAIVMPALVKGEIGDVFVNSFDLDGVNYDYAQMTGTIQYVNEDGDFEDLDDSVAEQLQAGGEVEAYFDAAGNLLYLKGSVGAVEINTDSLYLQGNIEVYADAKVDTFLEIEGINSAGKTESYEAKIKSLDEIKVLQGAGKELKYEVDKAFSTTDATKIDKFAIATLSGGVYTKVNATGPVAGAYIVALNEAGGVIGSVVKLSDYATPNTADAIPDGVERTNNVIKVNKNDSGTVVGLEFNMLAVDLNDSGLDEEDAYVNGYELSDSILIYDVSNSNKYYDADEDDVEVTTWGELKKNGVNLDQNEAKIYFNKDGKVTFIVTYSNSVADDAEKTALITAIAESDGKITRISTLVNGEEKNFEVKDSNADAVAVGDLAIITVNEAGTIVTDLKSALTNVTTTNRVVTGLVTKVDVGNAKITVGGVEYKLGSASEVYDASDAKGSDYSIEDGLRDVEVGDTVVIGLSVAESKFADVVVIKTHK